MIKRALRRLRGGNPVLHGWAVIGSLFWIWGAVTGDVGILLGGCAILMAAIFGRWSARDLQDHVEVLEESVDRYEVYIKTLEAMLENYIADLTEDNAKEETDGTA